MVTLKIVNLGGTVLTTREIDPLTAPTISDMVAFRPNETEPRVVMDILDVIMDYTNPDHVEIHAVVDFQEV